MALTYTSTLSESIASELDGFVEKYRKTKREIIETALTEYLQKVKKAEYIASFKRASQDKDMVEMANWGLEDYLKLLDE